MTKRLRISYGIALVVLALWVIMAAIKIVAGHAPPGYIGGLAGATVGIAFAVILTFLAIEEQQELAVLATLVAFVVATGAIAKDWMVPVEVGIVVCVVVMALAWPYATASKKPVDTNIESQKGESR